MTQEVIRLVKLTNGECLITRIKVNEQEEYATLIEPMKVHKWMQQHEDGDGAYENATFGPWETFSDDQIFHISKSKILTLTNPREDVIRYYHKIVEKVKKNPIDSFDDEPVENVQQLQDILDKMNEKLGITSEDEDILEYMYNKEKITKH